MRCCTARWVAPTAILAMALGVRLAMWHATLATVSLDDEAMYEWFGRALATGVPAKGLTDWPPGFIAYCAAFQRLLGAGTSSARLGSVLTGTATVWATLAIAWRLAGRRAALIAGLAAALHPELVFYSVSLFSEALYMPLVLGGLLAVSASSGVAGPRRMVIGGLLFGLAVLTRDVGLLPAAGAVGWSVVESRRGARSLRWRPVILAGTVLATVLPWSMWINNGSPVLFLTSRLSPVTLYVGNVPFECPETHPGFLARSQWIRAGVGSYNALGDTDAERQVEARRATRKAILQQMPAWPWIKLKAALPRLLVPSSLPVARLLAHPDDPGTTGKWAYRGTALSSRTVRKAIAYPGVVGWLLIGGCGLPGLALAARRPFGRLLVVFTTAHVLAVVIAFAVSRHRLPIEPVLIASASFVLVSGRSLWAEATWRTRLAAIILLLAFVFLTVAGWETVRVPQWV